jgi:hypothetical protein
VTNSQKSLPAIGLTDAGPAVRFASGRANLLGVRDAVSRAGSRKLFFEGFGHE